jgi:hypothetical protein
MGRSHRRNGTLVGPAVGSKSDREMFAAGQSI